MTIPHMTKEILTVEMMGLIRRLRDSSVAESESERLGDLPE